ncbi:MgtC/SapB family protein [Cereibacter azotoformans]|uniref:Protein MgtC n=1 Tax=Cereibacter azotoformans TaxID=43057 RepID=A0A2T5K909_9RHOB|nr:MgtC/SapB family protein [Cereibacter azotoformans]AXQ95072.1 MgtC/SapB family protein [Cereibacter sphaeroides]MBO4168974.1 MgtC/SapB family protein [Cereibacter azotoformans]PTR18905.1 putative Mg2+ transporter-C (MgtC) family protein [Cereibacter azotoformans]UIJ31677.1 MgtC/SapB family protein [Cereibacter azotoformans]
MVQLLQDFLAQDLVLPMFSSLLTGLLIGFDREMRGKPAGLRTHALVCFAATVLTLAAARQAEWTVSFLGDTQIVADPARMAHGILTGIGFLGAGVIFREGASVHGLTTAASLWVTSAIGIVYGVGMYWLAVAATVATLVVLVALRLFYALLPVRTEVRLRVTVRLGSRFDARRLTEILRSEGLEVGPVSRSLSRPSERLRLSTATHARREAALDRLARALTDEEDVLSFDIMPVEDPAGRPLPDPLAERD